MIGLLDNEKIILIKRKHWFAIATEGCVLFILAFVPIIAVYILSALTPVIFNFFADNVKFVIFFQAVWFLIMWLIFFVSWTNYYLDTLIVTNKRIVDIEQLGLFSRDLAELRLEHIQDIKVEVLGFLNSLLKMGTLHIQTAGQSKEVLIKQVPEVHEVQKIISKCLDEYKPPKS